MAITRTARGSITSKTSGSTLTIASQTIAARSLLVVYLAYDDQTLNSVTFAGTPLTLGDPVLGAGVRTRLAWGYFASGGTGTIVATWASAITAKAMSADSFVSSQTTWVPNDDANATNTGTGTAASTAATAAIVGGTESIRVGVVGTEGPSGDTAGTWAEPNTNGLRVGTTGNPAQSNVTVSAAYRLAPTAGSTTALSKTGMTSRDWGAAIRSFYWALPITVVGGSFTADAILKKTVVVTGSTDIQIYGSAEDNHIVSNSGTYSTARESGTLSLGTASAGNWVAGQSTGFNCYQGFISFDTSILSGETITAASLRLHQLATNGTNSSEDIIVAVRDWGTAVETTDWVVGSSLSSLTAVATFVLAGWASGTAKTESSTALRDSLNTSGSTRFILFSTGQRDAVQPGFAARYLSAASQDHATEANRPLLTVTVGTPITMDAVLAEAEATVQSFTANAILKNTVSGTFTANAVLAGPGSGSFSADAILKKTVERSASIIEIVANTSDGYTTGVSSNYSTARSNSTGSFVDTSAPSLRVGVGLDASFYYTFESFLLFDTSAVSSDGIVGARLKLARSNYAETGKYAGWNDSIEIRSFDWGNTLEAADHIGSTDHSSHTLRASVPFSNFSDGVNDYTEIDIGTSSVTFSGTTRFVINSEIHRTGSATPSAMMDLQFQSANSTSPLKPTLVIIPANHGFTADAVLSSILGGTFTANAVIRKPDNAATFTANSILRATAAGTFTADAWLSSTVSNTFTANAVLKATTSSTFTADAYLISVVSGSFTANAVLLKPVTNTFTADAYLISTVAGSITANSVLKRTEQTTFSANSVLKGTLASSFTADAVLTATATTTFTSNAVLRRSESGTLTADARLLRVESGTFTADSYMILAQSGSFTANAVLRKTTEGSFSAAATLLHVNSTTLTADAVISATAAGSFTADALLLAAVANTFTADAYLIYVESDTFTADAVLQTEISEQFTTDARLLRVESDSLTADAVLRRTESGAFTADALLRSIVADEFTADSYLISRVENNFTADALLQSVVENTFTADAFILVEGSNNFSADAVLKATTEDEFTADAVLAASGGDTFTADAWIKGITEATFVADSILRKSAEATFSADAILLSTYEWQFYANAVLQATLDQAFTADAVLSRTAEGSFTADAYLLSEGASVFTADAVLRREATGEFVADAILLATNEWQFYANAILSAPVDGTFTADAYLLNAAEQGFTADAVLRATPTGTLLADSILLRAVEGSFSADAYLLAVPGATFNADAILQATSAHALTADAVLQGTVESAFTADAYLLLSTGDTFTADAILLVAGVNDFTADSVLLGTVQSTFTADARLIPVPTRFQPAIIRPNPQRVVRPFAQGSLVSHGQVQVVLRPQDKRLR